MLSVTVAWHCGRSTDSSGAAHLWKSFISTLTNRRPAGKSERIYLWVFFCEERFVFLEKRRKKHIL